MEDEGNQRQRFAERNLLTTFKGRAALALKSHRASEPRSAFTLIPAGVKIALMDSNDSSAARSRLDITPKWDDIQTCIITCYALNKLEDI
jgi:hypothetical protein